MSIVHERIAPTPVDTIKVKENPKLSSPYPPIGKNPEHVPIHVRSDVFYY
jgi:hypothetical protein